MASYKILKMSLKIIKYQMFLKTNTNSIQFMKWKSSVLIFCKQDESSIFASLSNLSPWSSTRSLNFYPPKQQREPIWFTFTCLYYIVYRLYRSHIARFPQAMPAKILYQNGVKLTQNNRLYHNNERLSN